MSEAADLPPGWITARLGDAVLSITYGHTASASDKDVGPRFLRITDIQDDRVDWSSVPRCVCDSVDKYALKAGDIVVARTGATTGKSFLIDVLPEPAVFASYLIRLETSRTILPEFVSWFMRSPSYWTQITQVSKGTAQPGANASILSDLQIPIAPLNEQTRLTVQVQKLTEKSHRAKEALDAIPPLLERFRQSVLAAAFRGDLTAEWRAKNPDVEPADKLLQRIRTERRRRWEEAELAKMQAKGKTPGDDRWKERYKEPDSIDQERMSELPEGWTWASVDQLSLDIVDCPHSTPVYGSGSHFAVDTTCIVPGAVVLDKLRRVDFDTYQLRTRRLVPQSGDVVFAREGTVGTAASLPEAPNMCLGQRVMLMRPSLRMEGKWLEQALMCHLVTSQYAQKLVGSTVAHLNVGDVVRLAIPVPPGAEQAAIMRLLMASVKHIESMATIAKVIQREHSSLDRSILAKAFRGDLVPQDPSDEPASVLLDRIRRERAAAELAKDKKAPRRPR